MSATNGRGPMMMPAEVAELFSVTAKTVTRWASEGRLPHVVTLGGHRRYRRAEVEAMAAEAGYGVAT